MQSTSKKTETESVTRQTIAAKISTAAELGLKESAEVVNQVVALITDALNKGQDVLISGFGKFELLSKKARQGRNPRTGTPVTIQARKVVKFRGAESLKAHLTEAAVNTHS